MYWGGPWHPWGYHASPGIAFRGLPGLLGLSRMVIGGPWEVLAEFWGSLGDPRGVLGAALCGFGSNWGNQPLKDEPESISCTALGPTVFQKGGPKDPCFD